MSTLGGMKTEISNIIKRTGYTTFIANSISHAIETMQIERFFFNELLSATFSTVADQVYYDGDDDADIPLFNQFDAIHVTISNNNYGLRRYRDVGHFEMLNDANVSSGQPTGFLYYNKQLGIYPPPDQVYTATLMGGYDVAAPASDGEEDNVWMVEGYQLVMNEALRWLYAVHIKNMDQSRVHEKETERHRNRLRSRTAKLKGNNRIVPTYF